MVGYVILGMLAAFGALCAIWVLLGWLIPGVHGCAVVCWGIPDEGILMRYRWLRDLGLLSCPLLAIAEDEKVGTDAELCSGKDLLSRLEMERKRFDGTGNGDHSGHHHHGGVSEL